MATDEESSAGFSLEGIEDVEEDFVWGNEEESLAAGRSTHLLDLIKMANKAFRMNRYEEAVNYYSRAHNIKPDDLVILSNRCAAYLKIGHFLKHRPDAQQRPLSGLDPTTHASLALKDVEHFMNLQNHTVMAYILKANALILLERFELARDVILTGLQLDDSRLKVGEGATFFETGIKTAIVLLRLNGCRICLHQKGQKRDLICRI